MKTRILARLIFLTLALGAACVQGAPFEKQPKIQKAEANLNQALAKIEKMDVKDKEGGKLKQGAIVDLNMAKTSLDDAAKNKGSYRNHAIEYIDKALKDLEAKPLDMEKIKADIKGALKETTLAGRSGRS
jgi:septation ring formation regulator EzrA